MVGDGKEKGGCGKHGKVKRGVEIKAKSDCCGNQGKE